MALSPKSDVAPVRELGAHHSRRILIDVAGERIGDELTTILRARGLVVERFSVATLDAAPSAYAGVVWQKAPRAEVVAQLARYCRQAAELGRAIVVLATGQQPDLHRGAAMIGYLQCHGAVVCTSPQVFIETLVLLGGIGAPRSACASIVATPGSLLANQAHALSSELARTGSRLTNSLDQTRPTTTGAVFVDPRDIPEPLPELGEVLLVPVVLSGELTREQDRVVLVGLHGAMRALNLAATWTLRVAAGLGPDPEEHCDNLQPDRERFARQLRKLGTSAGDHESKVLLASYGVPVIRQAVATTPSAATRIAKRAGFPVDIKAWGPDIASEAEGCKVAHALTTAADVRRAFTAMATSNLEGRSGAVIVRESPPIGRELSAEMRVYPAIGWTVTVSAPDAVQPLSAPAPLSAADATRLANIVQGSRIDDSSPNRAALADLLRRASHMVFENRDVIARFSLPRIVLSNQDQRVLVVDAHSELAARS